jgi:hypothetical protein
MRRAEKLREALAEWSHSYLSLEPVLDAARSYLAILEQPKVWLCVEAERGVSNLPGSKTHCFFTSKQSHLSGCGWFALAVLTDQEEE